jgi:hypothetical protein
MPYQKVEKLFGLILGLESHVIVVRFSGQKDGHIFAGRDEIRTDDERRHEPVESLRVRDFAPDDAREQRVEPIEIRFGKLTIAFGLGHLSSRALRVANLQIAAFPRPYQTRFSRQRIWT